jgi:hypothetical protein
MNKKTAVILYSSAFVFGVHVTHTLLNKRQQKKIDAQRAANLRRDLAIVHEAADRVQRRALTGYYVDKSLLDIENDFSFEVIALHEED